MTSYAQKNKGYPIPEVIEPETSRCVIIKIPDDDAYYRALIAQTTDLSKWWSWKRTAPETSEAKFSAEHYRSILQYTTIDDIINCDAWEGNGGLIVTTPQELCDAVECGVIKVFERAVSGSSGNTLSYVTTDEEGNPIIVDNTGSGGAPSVDANRKEMARMEYIENRVEEFLADYQDYYAVTSFDPIVMEQFMTAKYLLNAGITQAIADYIAFRALPAPSPNVSLNGVDRKMYCYGYTKQTVSAFIIDDAIGDKTLRLTMLDALTQEQFDQWYEQETSSSDDYISTECYLAPNAVLVQNAQPLPAQFFDRQPISELALYSNTRAIVDISGKFIGDNGDTYDGMYTKLNNVYVWHPMSVTGATLVTPQPAPSDNGYSVIWSIGGSVTKIRFEANLITAQGYQGEITLNFEDVGAII